MDGFHGVLLCSSSYPPHAKLWSGDAKAATARTQKWWRNVTTKRVQRLIKFEQGTISLWMGPLRDDDASTETARE